MLKFETDKLDDVPEAVRSMYEEKGGKFRLKVDGLPSDDGLKAKNTELLDELKGLRRKQAEEAERIENERRELLAKSGDVEALRKDYDARMAKQREEYEVRLTGLSGQLQGLTVGQTASALAAELAVQGSAKALLPHIKARLAMEMRDGTPTTVVIGADGKPSAMTVEELKAEFANDPAFAPLIAAGKASGGGASGGNKGGGAAKVISRQQFDALSPADRMAHVKGGGKIT